MTTIHNRRSISGFTLCVLCLCAVVFLGGCKEEQKKELKAPLRIVRSKVVFAGAGTYERSFAGRLHAAREAGLSFKVPGTIKQIPVNVGDPVKKGDVIAVLDPSTYSLEAQQSRAALDEARSELRNAKANYARIKKLGTGLRLFRHTI